MKKNNQAFPAFSLMLFFSLTFFAASAQTAAVAGSGSTQGTTANTAGLTQKQATEWFDKKAWIGGLQMQPHESINKQEFAKYYQQNKNGWDKAFAYLKETDLASLKPGRYPVDGDNVYAIVTEGPTKSDSAAMWEAHRNYVDVHVVINGREKIGVTPFSTTTVSKAYDPAKDIGYYTGDGKYYIAEPNTFFIFFPEDAHRPGIKVDGYNTDKKVVLKVKTAS